MKRDELKELNYIIGNVKKFGKPCPGCTMTIRTDASTEYKMKLHRFYTELNMHPCSVRVDNRFYDDKERIIYIYDLTWFDAENRPQPWYRLYSKEQLNQIALAIGLSDGEALKAGYHVGIIPHFFES